MSSKQLISNFVKEVEIYQSNHYGYYDRNELINAYNKLPLSVKFYFSPPKETLSKLWRGCDGLSEHRAISFTTNKGYAETFGAFVLPFNQLQSFKGLIMPDKILKLCDRMGLECNVGDDEGEVIVLHPVWKNGIDLNNFRV